MRGIVLKDSIELFGFKIGFSHWFRWSFTDPVKMFYWKYIIAKHLCTNCGYFLCKPDCQHKKITGRRNIIKYEKERHKQIEKESNTIIKGENGECAYCSEEKGTEIIDDPNWDTLERWKVCETCKEVVELQRESSFPLISMERQQEIGERLLEISKQTGKQIFSMEMNEGKVSSVKYGEVSKI